MGGMVEIQLSFLETWTPNCSVNTDIRTRSSITNHVNICLHLQTVSNSGLFKHITWNIPINEWIARTTRLWHWKSHWKKNKKNRVPLKIERTRIMSNADNFQWDFKGLTFLDNNSRQIIYSVWVKRKMSVWYDLLYSFSLWFQWFFSVVGHFSVILSKIQPQWHQ